jgi:peptidoglycan/LPS O-acetylase OafA/YrhL
MRLGLGQFAVRRMLRIYPGLLVCLAVVAFVFAPLTALGTGVPFHLSLAARFVWSNATTVLSHQVIGNELNRAPYPGSWDGPLWTLQHELTCYAVIGLVLCWGLARRDVTRTMVAVLTVVTAFNVASALIGVVPGPAVINFLRLAAYFAAGSLLWSLGERIRVNRWTVAGSVFALSAFAAAGVVDLWGALPLAYLVLAFGAWCPIRWGVDRDLSYGVYVYGWPVQQMLVLVGIARFGPVVFIGAAIALVVPLAWLSWLLVEHPALRLARRRSPMTVIADRKMHAAASPFSNNGTDEATVPTTRLASTMHCGMRCPLLRPDPAERDRLTQIHDNLLARIAEAETHRWFGEAEGLKVSLAGARSKLAEMDQISARRSTAIHLGTPVSPMRPAAPTVPTSPAPRADQCK